MITFCGFKMLHPHDSYSIIRVAYKEPVEVSTIKGHIKECINDSIEVFTKIRKEFLKLVPR
jgi:DNA-directed RNA polymerase subunit L